LHCLSVPTVFFDVRQTEAEMAMADLAAHRHKIATDV
jgi:hypothetical protein